MAAPGRKAAAIAQQGKEIIGHGIARLGAGHAQVDRVWKIHRPAEIGTSAGGELEGKKQPGGRSIADMPGAGPVGLSSIVGSAMGGKATGGNSGGELPPEGESFTCGAFCAPPGIRLRTIA